MMDGCDRDQGRKWQGGDCQGAGCVAKSESWSLKESFSTPYNCANTKSELNSRRDEATDVANLRESLWVGHKGLPLL